MEQNSNHHHHGEQREERILQSIYDHLLKSVVVSYASNMHEMIKTGQINAASELQTPSSRQESFPNLYHGKTPEEIQSLLEKYATEEISNRRSNKRKLPPGGGPERSNSSNTPGIVVAEVGTKEEEIKLEGEDDEEEDGDDNDDSDEDFKDEENEDDNEIRGAGKQKDSTTTKMTTSSTTTTAGNGGGPVQQQQSSSQEQLEQQQTPAGVDIWGRIPSKEASQPVDCTLCGRQIGSSRFASHLEKCMGISTRPLGGIPSSIRNTTGMSNSSSSHLK